MLRFPFLPAAGVALAASLCLGASASAQTAPRAKAAQPAAKHAAGKPAVARKPAKSAPDAGVMAPPTLTEAERAKVEARARQMTASLQGALSLAPAQVTRVQTINESAVEQVELARRQYLKEPRRLRQELDLIDLSRLSRLKDVLTPPQFDRYVAMRAQKMGLPAEATGAPGNANGGGAAGSGMQVPAGQE